MQGDLHSVVLIFLHEKYDLMSLNGRLIQTDVFACVLSNHRRTGATIPQYSMYTLTLHRVEVFLLKKKRPRVWEFTKVKENFPLAG